MCKILQLLFFSFISTFYCGGINGNDVKCICSNQNEVFITTMSGKIVLDEGEVTSRKTENQILERLDSILETTKAIKEKNVTSPIVISTQNGANQCLHSSLCNNYPRSCAEAAANSRRSGVYSIQIDSFGPKQFQVSCEEDLHGGGWTVVLSRKDGTVDFFREWADYKQGFGNLEGEFFIGLDKLHALTNGPYIQELIFVLEDFDKAQKYAKYSSFAIGDESERYVLKTLGKYSGDAGDSLSNHAGHVFKTKEIEDVNKCATTYIGAWWYTACHSSNLFGKYLSGSYGQEKYAQGVVWQAFRGYNYSLKVAMMMIRPKRD